MLRVIDRYLFWTLIILAVCSVKKAVAQDMATLKTILMGKTEEAVANHNFGEALDYIHTIESHLGTKQADVLYLKINIMVSRQAEEWPYCDSAIAWCDTFFRVVKKNQYPQEKYEELVNLSLELKGKMRKYNDDYSAVKTSGSLPFVEEFIVHYPKSDLAKSLATEFKTQIEEKKKIERQKIINDSTHKAIVLNARLNMKQADEFFRAKNYEKAFEQYSLAANYNDHRAKLQLAAMYLNALWIAQDEKLALEWYQKASKDGMDSVEVDIIKKIADGYMQKNNDDMAFLYYSISGGFDEPHSEEILGSMYRNGHGVPRDDSMSFKWYQKAANKGNGVALCQMGFMYEAGLGVGRDIKVAMSFYEKAVLKEDCEAKCRLAKILYLGSAGKKDYARSFNLYSDEACSCTDSKYYLGIMLMNGGFGREADKEAGIKILKADALNRPGGSADVFLIGKGYKKPPKEQGRSEKE